MTRVSRPILIVTILCFLLVSLTGCFGLSLRGKRHTVAPAATAFRALEYALSKEKAAYLLGGRGPDVFDCSGLITWSYKQAVGRDAMFRVGSRVTTDAIINDLWRFNVVLLPMTDMLPGDVVFITNDHDRVTHGGLFVRWINNDEFEFINASSYHGHVVIDRWPIGSTQRGQWLVGAGRLKIVY